MSCITIKNKNVNSAFDIKGIKLLCSSGTSGDKIDIVETEKLILELDEEVIKKKKVIKKK
jgi:hypothetical protein